MSSLRKSAVAPILLAKRQSGSAWPEIVSILARLEDKKRLSQN